MIRSILILSFLLLSLTYSFTQDNTVILSTSQFESHQRLFLAPLEGWLFHQGNNPDWASPNLDVKDWQKFKPTELSTRLEDETGRVEGWFRIKIKLDKSFSGMPLALSRTLWAATDIYLDGKLIHSFGNTGNPYEAFNPILKYPIAVPMVDGQEYLLAIHFVDYETTFTQREIRLKPDNLKGLINLTGPEFYSHVTNDFKQTHIYATLCIAISLLLFLLFWLLVYLNKSEKIFWLIASLTTLVLLSAIGLFYNTFFEISYPSEKLRFVLTASFQPGISVFALIILEWVLTKRITWIPIAILFVLTITSTTAHLFSISPPFGVSFTAMLAYFAYLLYSNWKTISGGQWAVVAALVIPLLGVITYVNLHKYSLDLFYEYEKPITSLTVLMTPLLLLVYISVRFKEVLKTAWEESQKVLRVTEEKKELLANQNILLEKQVQDRTAELNTSLENLKSTQSQLIQSEKMASLGELTAGIAHEIQNPLNFVNNFSDVNTELIDELIEEITLTRPTPKAMADGSPLDDNYSNIIELANDIKANEEKIKHHGGRADSIVKGMLQHSRTSTGEKEPTDINELADEYLRLAYHGMRAKDNSFNATMETDFDDSIGKIQVIPQDIGRVLLNLITNALQAVASASLSHKDDYQPTISISTKQLSISEASAKEINNSTTITISDNGHGIPDSIKDKIFQPFFTTKATGEGTGLGLSLAYDIVKAHGGELELSSDAQNNTVFTITIPTDR